MLRVVLQALNHRCDSFFVSLKIIFGSAALVRAWENAAATQVHGMCVGFVSSPNSIFGSISRQLFTLPHLRSKLNLLTKIISVQPALPTFRAAARPQFQQTRSIVYLWKRYIRPRPDDVPKPISNPSMAQRYHDEITQLVNDNKHNEAIKKWDEMRLAGILPLEGSYKLAMRMFEQKGDVEGVLEAFDELQHNGYSVDQVSRNILLDMHMKRGDVMNAERVFKEMLQAQSADLYSYNRVLDMYIMVRSARYGVSEYRLTLAFRHESGTGLRRSLQK
jgi:pentatricopeptide repeat protein